MSTLAQPAAEVLSDQIALSPTVKLPSDSRRFHLFMASACFIIFAISVLGCCLTSIQVAGIGSRAVGVLAVITMLLPMFAYWHQKGRIAFRDATLTIPWALLLFELLPFPVVISARLRLPLQDATLAHFDRLLGVNVQGIMAWARGHGMGPALTHVYYMLIPFLLVAIFVPALTGKVQEAQEFLVANVIAFAVAMPTFALLPAVGPWYFYGFSADPMQSLCQRDIFRLRLPAAYSFLSQQSGIVCFPSFHVVWAVLCVAALWGFRPLRVPLVVLSTMIILSTMTTGWHYFVDVLGGLVLAVISLALAKRFLRFAWLAEVV